MQRNQYGNLAVSLNQQSVQLNHESGSKQRKKKGSVYYGIPVKEKLLYLFCVIVIVTISAFILSRYSLISQYNYEIEKTKKQILSLQEQNSSLKLKRDELRRRDRILDIAQNELGMTVKDSTVRVLSH